MTDGCDPKENPHRMFWVRNKDEADCIHKSDCHNVTGLCKEDRINSPESSIECPDYKKEESDKK